MRLFSSCPTEGSALHSRFVPITLFCALHSTTAIDFLCIQGFTDVLPASSLGAGTLFCSSQHPEQLFVERLHHLLRLSPGADCLLQPSPKGRWLPHNQGSQGREWEVKGHLPVFPPDPDPALSREGGEVAFFLAFPPGADKVSRARAASDLRKDSCWGGR